MTTLAPIEKHLIDRSTSTEYNHVSITRCKLCKSETANGHPITVCVFALMKRIEYLETRCQKLEAK